MSPAVTGRKRTIVSATTTWRGVTLLVSYEAAWFGMVRPADQTIAHLQVSVMAPDRGPLPITDSSYRSRYLPPGAVAAAGGPVAYVQAWLDEAAQSPAWKAREDAARQLSLF